MQAPTNWLQVLDNIRKVRLKYPAPVDSMGCDQALHENENDIDKRFQILTSLMLSSQTKDPITWAAVQRLKSDGKCSVDGILQATEKDIEDLIHPVGFYRRKAVYLKKVARILKEDYSGDIPRTIRDLCNLPGVGPKMAHLCMAEAWNSVTGIGVDTHVHRISARLGWVPSKGIKSPEDTRKALESWLPQEYWKEINHLLVGFGQTICTPVGPKCDKCDNNSVCPSSTVGKKSSKRQPEFADRLSNKKVQIDHESLNSSIPKTSKSKQVMVKSTSKQPPEVKVERPEVEREGANLSVSPGISTKVSSNIQIKVERASPQPPPTSVKQERVQLEKLRSRKISSK